MVILPRGVRHMPGHLPPELQRELVEAIRGVVRRAPLYVPTMPKTGKEMSVRMTNCGTLGWVTDKDGGYRYQPVHPMTNEPWPPIPALLLSLWREVAAYPHLPEACLVNFYEAGTRMGQHQDRDEADFSAPVVSVSLGDDCLFRIGGTRRRDPSVSVRLTSGDVVVLGGESRLAFHGVDRIYPSTSALLKQGGRINLTLRRVSAPPILAL
jgi:alkylated DNA repair protein (DNA oxidative demethylase)